ncbi:Uncharacterised protein [Sphingobacterium spiritivorum]|nr:Uncharacterised protein [Sphingobacterium spiritivorum]
MFSFNIRYFFNNEKKTLKKIIFTISTLLTIVKIIFYYSKFGIIKFTYMYSFYIHGRTVY